MKITTLTQENGRLGKDIDELKKSFEDATRQLKDVAVKVIESRSVSSQSAPHTEI